jgi:hypothetical protein
VPSVPVIGLITDIHITILPSPNITIGFSKNSYLVGGWCSTRHDDMSMV